MTSNLPATPITPEELHNQLTSAIEKLKQQPPAPKFREPVCIMSPKMHQQLRDLGVIDEHGHISEDWINS